MSALNQIIAALGGVTTAIHFSSSDSFEVPGGVTSISLLALGGGGGGNDCQAGGGSGGAGGGLSFSNSVSVTPGETLTITIGSGGARGTWGGGGLPGTGGTGGTTSIKRGAAVLVEATGGQGGYSQSMAAVGGNVSGGVGDTQYNGGSGGLPAGSEIRGGQGGGAGDIAIGANGTNGVTATTDYRGGGEGPGLLLTGSPINGYQVTVTSANAASYNGESNSSVYFGAGGGGGTYGDAGFTLTGIGAAGTGGMALLAWGGRTFTGGDNSF